MVAFATQVKRRRGTEAQNNEFTGAEGEIVVDMTNMTLRVHDGTTRGGFPQATQAEVQATQAEVNDLRAQVLPFVVPTGAFMAFAGTTAPTGWLICDGGEISRDNYASLFNVIGEMFGAGDGSNTFNLPNLDGRMPWYDSAAAIGNQTNGGVPNVTGSIYNTQARPPLSLGGITATGAMYLTRGQTAGNCSPTGSYANIPTEFGINASSVSPVYDSGTTVRPAAVYTIWCIKY